MQKLSNLDTEIKEKLLPFRDSEEYKERSMNLKKTLEKEENKQKLKKKKKYNRDMEDYQTGIVFEWQNKIVLELQAANNPLPGRDPNKSVNTLEQVQVPRCRTGTSTREPQRLEMVPIPISPIHTLEIGGCNLGVPHSPCGIIIMGDSSFTYREEGNRQYNIPVGNRYDPLASGNYGHAQHHGGT